MWTRLHAAAATTGLLPADWAGALGRLGLDRPSPIATSLSAAAHALQVAQAPCRLPHHRSRPQRLRGIPALIAAHGQAVSEPPLPGGAGQLPGGPPLCRGGRRGAGRVPHPQSAGARNVERGCAGAQALGRPRAAITAAPPPPPLPHLIPACLPASSPSAGVPPHGDRPGGAAHGRPDHVAPAHEAAGLVCAQRPRGGSRGG